MKNSPSAFPSLEKFLESESSELDAMQKRSQFFADLSKKQNTAKERFETERIFKAYDAFCEVSKDLFAIKRRLIEQKRSKS